MVVINLSSLRARKARLGQRIGHGGAVSLGLTAAGIVLAGIALISVRQPLGWLVMSLAVLPLGISLWYCYELQEVPSGRGTDLDQVLGSRILGNLPPNASPRQIAEAAMRSHGALFLAVRMGLTAGLIRDMSSDDPAASEQVWQMAENYRVQLGDPEIRGSMVVAALCVTQPPLKAALPHLQLDEDDVLSGVRWSSHLLDIIAEAKKPRHTGGVARDWNFGYANLLEQFGLNISQYGGSLHTKLESHTALLAQMLAIFGEAGRQNVALVGPVGTGKSTLVHGFAERLLIPEAGLPKSLSYKQVVALDASAIIGAARTRSELEQLVSQLFYEAFQAKNIIIFLDDAQLFFEEGNGSVDLTALLMPVLDGGRLQVILAMEEQAYLRISQRNPGLASALNRLNVAASNQAETMIVAQDQVVMIEGRQRVTYLYQSLKEAYRLSERYIHDLAQPGKTVRLLEQAARHARDGLVTMDSVAQVIEQSSGVKVGRADGAEERLTLLHMEDLIHQRMVNQVRAVSVVSDALRRARAGVRNELRPVGTFLFLGPTGVGKTELAKALAAVYYGGEDRLVRLDLNEFVQPSDVNRLIADGAEDPHSLTASILKQPFSVVLLDEIEKAHPQVLTTLLQLLDEGILRDIHNKEVSFRDAIVIATSNAGAERIRQLIDQGQQLEQFETQFVNELIDSQQFRPEFLNRFDEIVVFRPLTQDELVEVVNRMIEGVNKTLAAQKLRVELAPEASLKLAAIGYDPRLGARPMRRTVQRCVENLVAKRVLEGTTQAGQTIFIAADDITG